LLSFLLSAVLSSPIVDSSSSSSESNELPVTRPTTSTLETSEVENLEEKKRDEEEFEEMEKEVLKAIEKQKEEEVKGNVESEEESSESGESSLSSEENDQDRVTTTVESTTVDTKPTSQIPEVQLTERTHEPEPNSTAQSLTEARSEPTSKSSNQAEPVAELPTLELKDETLTESTTRSETLSDSPIVEKPSTVSPQQNVHESEVTSTSPAETHTTSTQATRREVTTQPSPLYKFSGHRDPQTGQTSTICDNSCSLASNCTVVDTEANCSCIQGYSDQSQLIDSSKGTICSVCASAHSDVLILFDNSRQISQKQLIVLKKIVSTLIEILDSNDTDNRVGLISIGGKAHLKFGIGSNGEKISQWISQIGRTAGRRDIAGAFEIITEQVWLGLSDRKRHMILVTDGTFASCAHKHTGETLSACTIRELIDPMTTIRRLGVYPTIVYGGRRERGTEGISGPFAPDDLFKLHLSYESIQQTIDK
ncbi:hypothetical protein PFISCL1PPCAC_26516, partial [Pristionchus fissidentatus]